MRVVHERGAEWLSLALIPVPAAPRKEADAPTAYVPPPEVYRSRRSAIANAFRWARS